MEFYPGFDIESREKDMEFVYGPEDVYKRQAYGFLVYEIPVYIR